MNQKTIYGIIAVILVICVLGIILFFVNDNRTLDDNNQTNGNTNTSTQTPTNRDENTTTIGDGKVLVVYFSAQNHTEAVANQIAENLDADVFEIVPTEEYTSDDLDWTDDNSRVSREHEDESLRNVELTSTTVENWNQYDTVLIGYPIWWGLLHGQ